MLCKYTLRYFLEHVFQTVSLLTTMTFATKMVENLPGLLFHSSSFYFSIYIFSMTFYYNQ
jgi:hypothetical protein